jgi:hypothetical protein
MSAAVAHRPTSNIGHKPFKSRKATKGQLRDAAKGGRPPTASAFEMFSLTLPRPR